MNELKVGDTVEYSRRMGTGYHPIRGEVYWISRASGYSWLRIKFGATIVKRKVATRSLRRIAK